MTLEDDLVRRIKYLGAIKTHSTLDFDTLLMMDESDGVPPNEPLTDTVRRQLEVETTIQEIYDEVLEAGSQNFPSLNRIAHQRYTGVFLHRDLPAGFCKLDASHPWMIFWLINATVVLGGTVDDATRQQATAALVSYIQEDGGMAGGYGQLSHLASTYAGLMAMALIGEDWEHIDRSKIHDWLLSLKNEDGSFKMHVDGETDCRAVYCALCIASVLDILDEDITKDTAEWLAKCQTFEGGFGGEPGDEAHGGYAFCALAALCILMPPKDVNGAIRVEDLVKWTTDRQYAIEGGLSGRTNKLVDGCYSHWVGGTSALLECVCGYRLLNRTALQNYILCCCQAEPFGLVDKPGCSPDFYHTNYVLCGLSMCQHYQTWDDGFKATTITDTAVIDNKPANLVAALDPIFGVPIGYIDKLTSFIKNNSI